jgi:type 1 fimbriae regulatory protein FimB/type 1 fimbriae regulatory protein FimE
VDFGHGLLHVRRIKNGTPSVHPMGGVEIRALRRLKREQAESRHVFLTERVAHEHPAGTGNCGREEYAWPLKETGPCGATTM